MLGPSARTECEDRVCAGTECWDCALRLSDTVTVETECWAPILRLKCLRLVGAGVSILAVPSSPSPPPVVQPVRNEQAARLISQLQVLHTCTCPAPAPCSPALRRPEHPASVGADRPGGHHREGAGGGQEDTGGGHSRGMATADWNCFNLT